MNDDLDRLLRSDSERWAQSQGEPPSLADAVHRATRRRDHRGVLAIAAIVAVVAAITAIPLVRSYTGDDTHAAANSSRPTPHPLTSTQVILGCCLHAPPSVNRELIQRVRSMAVANQDPQATATAVLTTYRIAERAVLGGDHSSSPAGSTRVWVIQMHGRFTCGSCSYPAGGSAPRGRIIDLVVDAETYEEYDFTITNQASDLNRLGTVVKIPI
jgi:hypothetical protein